MDCEKVRDRFSSLWEGELSPPEEKAFKEHLSSCPTCRREFEQFEKTMRWLHAAGEVEVPEGFLPGLHKKLEEKKRAGPGQTLGGRGFHVPLSFKLPVQAVAMVAVVFLVLYVTKMIPTEGIRLKETKQTPSPLSVQEKPDGALRPAPPGPISEGEVEKGPSGSTLGDRSRLVREAPHPEQSRGKGQGAAGVISNEVKREPRALEAPPEMTRPKDVEQAKAPVPGERKSEEAPVPQIKTEAEKRETPARRPEVLGYPVVGSREAVRASVPSPEPAKTEKKLAAPEKSRVSSKPPQDILLRISDRKRVIPLLHELVKQFGGEVVTAKEDMFLASIPTVSFQGFEKELAGIRSSFETDPLIAKKHAKGSLRLEEETKKEGGDEKSKGPARLAADAESRTIVRILLIEE